MANLLDVADTPAKVQTHKFGELNVYGLSIRSLAVLIKEHPELFHLFDASGNMKVGMQEIVDLGVTVLSKFLAAGLGYAGDKEAIERCSNMNAEDAWTIGNAIFEESFPGGATNFFARVSEAAKQAQILKAGTKPNLQPVQGGVAKPKS